MYTGLLYLSFMYYDQAMTSSEGLPMGVMVVAMRYHDEVCLRVMKDAESAAEFSVV